jgi:two-component system, OmpR family, heavy metal sensor histidine kinase CusS
VVDGVPTIVQVALDRTFEHRLLVRYRKFMLLFLLLGLAACALTGFAIARRGLRPLARMAGVMERVGSSTLHKRVDNAAFPADLSSLATTFNAMLQRLEDAFGRLSQFSADIAHELRTPVHNIRGMVELALAPGRGADEARALLVPCLEECQRVSRLIDNLLFIARAEQPQTQIARQPVNVAEQLAKVQEFYEAAASEAGITLECDRPASDANSAGDMQASLDRQLFQQAVSNLVENALAHTPPGGHVRMIAARKADVVQVEVCDTGAGIASEHLPFVFDRFRRVDASRSKHTGGMGLGLALVKSIAQLHGGTATAESQVGTGSRFILTFPVNGRVTPNVG